MQQNCGARGNVDHGISSSRRVESLRTDSSAKHAEHHRPDHHHAEQAERAQLGTACTESDAWRVRHAGDLR